MRLLALAFALGMAWPADSSAQPSSMDALQILRQQGMSDPGAANLPSDHFSRCRGDRWTPHERAIISCGRVIGERESRTSSATAYLERGTHHRELGDEASAQADFARAVDLYSQVIRSNPRSASALYFRGIALARIDEFDRALADYAAASALAPEWSGGHRSAGYVYFRRNEFDAALAAFDTATSIEQEDSNNHAARCQALTALRSFEAADIACSNAIRLDEANPYVYIALGYLRYRQETYEEAHAAFDRSLTLDGDHPLAAYGRGMSALRLGRSDGEAEVARALGQSRRIIALYANAGMAP